MTAVWTASLFDRIAALWKRFLAWVGSTDDDDQDDGGVGSRSW